MNIERLMVEVTRKCNMTCSHCCRGNARSESLDINKFQSFLRGVDYISTLTIGGGEPSLALKELNDLKQAIQRSNTKIGNIYVVTNGKRNIKNLTEWFEKMMWICDDNEISSIGFSFDQWHNEDMSDLKDNRNNNFYEAKDYLEAIGLNDKIQKHSDDNWDYSSLIKMGRSKDNGFREVKLLLIEIEEYDNNIELREQEIYYTVDGKLFSDCNLSYNEMTNKSKFHICDFNENIIDKTKIYNNKLKP